MKTELVEVRVPRSKCSIWLLKSLSSPYSAICLITIIAMVLIVVPYMLGLAIYEDCDGEQCAGIYEALASRELYTALVGSIFASIPLILEFLSSLFPASDFAYHGMFQKVCLFTSAILPDIVILIYVIPYNDVALLVCIFHLRNAMYTFAVIKHTLEYGAPIFRPFMCMTLLILFMVGHVLLSFATFTSPTNQSINLIVIMCSFGIALVIFFGLAVKLLRIAMKDGFRNITDLSNEILNINIFLIPALLFGFVYIVLCIVNNGTISGRTSASFLVLFTYSQAVFVNLVFLLQNRFFRLIFMRIALLQSKIETQKAELEIKRNFIRFISHEVRTPLNIALLGLDCLSNYVSDQKDAASEDAMVTLAEIKDACKSSVDILDDVLNFDKLTNGVMNLNLVCERAKRFTNNAVYAFKMMVRKSIHFILTIKYS